jgi:predicted O-methyltransferase YrrM
MRTLDHFVTGRVKSRIKRIPGVRPLFSTSLQVLNRVRKQASISRTRIAVERAWASYRSSDESIRIHVAHYNDYFFKELGVKREAAVKVWREVSDRTGIQRTGNDSIHRLAFAALSVNGFSPRNILELGTDNGDTALYLSELFPEGKIFTVELPDDDPIYLKWHPEGATAHRCGVVKRLARPNITSLIMNTAYLLEENLPDFDLIWLDAGHYFPEVAWDHFFCLHKLAPGGWLFTDDIRLPSNKVTRKRPSTLDAWTVVDYFNARQKDRFGLLLKREDPALFLIDPKFVGFLRKSSNEGRRVVD